MLKNRKDIEELFDIEEDMKITDDLLSIHAMNPFIAYISSPRGYMMGQHISQALVLNYGDEKIVQSGLEKQLGGNTFSKKIEKNSHVHKVISRYDNLSTYGCSTEVERFFIIEDEDGVLDYVSVPTYFLAGQDFGFKYNINYEILDSIKSGFKIKAGTVLADSPTIDKNNGYKLGVNANLAMLTSEEVSEDGVIISDSLADRMSFCMFEKRVLEIDKESILLNIYGDENNYKPFPAIGEPLRKDGVIAASRNIDIMMSPGLMSNIDLLNFDPTFDKLLCARGGDTININGKEYHTSVIEDIKIYSSGKNKKIYKTKANDILDGYAMSLRKFHSEIIEIYERLSKTHYAKFGSTSMRVSPRLHKLIVDSYAIANYDPNLKVALTYKNAPINGYRIEFIIRNNIKPSIPGYKISDFFGSKGVLINIKPREEMPYIIDENGNKIISDIIMDPSSVVSRMNPGRLYEQYFNGASRRCQCLITKTMGGKKAEYEYTNEEIEAGWSILLDFLSILETEQYEYYKSINSIEEKLKILVECIKKEVYIYYKAESKKKPYVIVSDIEKSPFKPTRGKPIYTLKNGKTITGKKEILIAPVYTILLSKTADVFLSSSSAKTNHHGLPVKSPNNISVNTNFKNSPTKVMSETEIRLFAAYAGRRATAELKDRANSIKTHRSMYKNILYSKNPSSLQTFVDRSVTRFGNDKSLEIIEYIFNPAGLSIDFVPGD